jgi:oligopeptide transport system permease protein
LAGLCYSIVRQRLVPYAVARLFEACVTVWAIATLTFLLLRFLPGGPFDQERAMKPEIRANIEVKYGLDKPVAEQYWNYLKNALLRGDLGPSYKYEGRPVSEIIAQALPPSFQLGFYSLLLSFAVGIPLGALAAARRNTKWDTGAMLLAISGVALPSFMVGPLLAQFFSFGVPFRALQGFLPPALWEGPAYYVLPVVTLGLRPAAIIARLVRSSMLETIESDFARTARAKGVSERAVLFKHVLRNSLIPTLSVAGPLAAGVLSGSFVIELVFAVPGIGKHLVQSVTNRDYPLIMGVTLVYAAMLALANLVVDLLYTVVDPRIKLA